MKVLRTWETPIDPNAAKACGGTAPKVIVGPPKEKASLLTKAMRLRRELSAWAKAGLPLAPREVRKQRLAICEACSYYDAKGNFGMGACGFPGCGCTRAKLALATSQCPHVPPKWNKCS